MWYLMSFSSWVTPLFMTPWEDAINLGVTFCHKNLVQFQGNTSILYLIQNSLPPAQVWPVSPGLSAGRGLSFVLSLSDLGWGGGSLASLCGWWQCWPWRWSSAPPSTPGCPQDSLCHLPYPQLPLLVRHHISWPAPVSPLRLPAVSTTFNLQTLVHFSPFGVNLASIT